MSRMTQRSTPIHFAELFTDNYIVTQIQQHHNMYVLDQDQLWGNFILLLLTIKPWEKFIWWEKKISSPRGKNSHLDYSSVTFGLIVSLCHNGIVLPRLYHGFAVGRIHLPPLSWALGHGTPLTHRVIGDVALKQMLKMFRHSWAGEENAYISHSPKRIKDTVVPTPEGSSTVGTLTCRGMKRMFISCHRLGFAIQHWHATVHGMLSISPRYR